MASSAAPAAPRHGPVIRHARRGGRPTLLAAAVAAAALAACSGGREQPRVPLGRATSKATAADSATALPPNHPPIGGMQSPILSGPARASLDSANIAFRAGRYEDALRAYRAAGAAAPNNAAPLFGIQMAARALGNAALADSAMRRIRELSPRAAPGDSVHAKIGAPAQGPKTH